MGFRIDPRSGVPFYRQIIDQVKYGMARGVLKPGDQLPTVRQLAVDLSINPNTVARAYQELEIRGLVATQMGTGTFIAEVEVDISELEKQRMLDSICTELLSRAASYGLTLQDVLTCLQMRKEP
jgi:GntR family transcriptional regulator